MAEMSVPFDDTEGRAVLFSSFPHRGGDEMMMMIWVRPPQYEGNGGTATIWG